jgi:hypothetical protein
MNSIYASYLPLSVCLLMTFQVITDSPIAITVFLEIVTQGYYYFNPLVSWVTNSAWLIINSTSSRSNISIENSRKMNIFGVIH